MTIRFRTNPEKALEVILWLCQKRPGIDFHSILKILFFADVKHLNEYGRPIVGDEYHALPYGPVAQTTYDILKRDALALEELGVEDLPFDVQGRYRVFGKRQPDLSKLSESDLEALEDAWEHYKDCNFGQRTDISHEHPAYKNAEGSQMFYEDFLEGDNYCDDVINELRETSRRLRV